MRTFNNIEEIKNERLLNRHLPVIYTLLSVILGELDRLPTRENPTPDQIYTVIKKLYEAAKEMREMTSEADQEYMYLKDFIKQMMTEDELRKVISESGCKNMGEIMKFLKMNYNGTYDGKMANMIAKEVL